MPRQFGAPRNEAILGLALRRNDMHATKLLAIIFSLTTLVLVQPAQAKHRLHHYSGHSHRHYAAPRIERQWPQFDLAALPAYPTEQTRQSPSLPMGRGHIAPSNGMDLAEGIVGGRPAGCPHAYCGCSASLYVFNRIIPELNLAANWRRFPPAGAGAGMAAWRYGHVFIIKTVNSDGTVVAYDGNSGHGLTRIHTISLRGYHVVNPHGARYASR